jgi:hypothetical protein
MGAITRFRTSLQAGRICLLATNPLAFAAPTGGEPMLLDMSTAMINERLHDLNAACTWLQ